jgi:hypothetical protein
MYGRVDGKSNNVGRGEGVFTFTLDQSVLAALCRGFRTCYTACYSE